MKFKKACQRDDTPHPHKCSPREKLEAVAKIFSVGKISHEGYRLRWEPPHHRRCAATAHIKSARHPIIVLDGITDGKFWRYCPLM